MSCAVVALAPLVARFTAPEPETGVVAAYASAPVTLSNVIAETTSTIHAEPDTVPSSTTTESTTTTTTAPTTTAPPTTAPPTTAAPTTAPPTTAAPATTAPPTTAAPTTSSQPEFAYSDPRSTQVWYDLAQCESHGNWSINTGNGYYGGLQFSLGSWRNVGGTGYPHEHSAQTQIEMGRRLQAAQGWGAWPHCSSELGLR